MDVVTVIGVIGAGLVLIAFSTNELRWLKSTSVWYDSLNLFGSVLLIYYAAALGSLPFIILNTVWFIFAGKDIVRRLW